ncbi:MAG: hypothetical protein GY796_36510 [Chloroflexi bacterium]|nr:hypothetical protein [Chloroflexota bacterium]
MANKTQNEKWLTQYNIGQNIQIDHPEGSGEEPATITAFTADMQGRLDGVMVKFEDGVWIEIEASSLP